MQLCLSLDVILIVHSSFFEIFSNLMLRIGVMLNAVFRSGYYVYNSETLLSPECGMTRLLTD